MKSLKLLRDNLLQAEESYKKAQSSLENSLELVIAKESLKQARFNYSNACQRVMNKLLDDNECILGSTKITWYYEEVGL